MGDSLSVGASGEGGVQSSWGRGASTQGMGLMFPGGREKGRARSGFLEEACRSASLLKAT